MTGVLCVLPARLGSRRLPRKPLRRAAGRPLIHWTLDAARRVEAFDEIRVATDAPEVAETVEEVGGRAVLTEADHGTGTDRVAEAVSQPWAKEFGVVVNFQADEPFLDPEGVGRAVGAVRDDGCPVATLAEPLASEKGWRSPHVVKVVRASDGRALYFSRAPIPYDREGPTAAGGQEGAPPDRAPPVFLRHAGLYAFRREALGRWTELPTSRLETVERLEQLRALEAGLEIHVALGEGGAPGVDTPEELRRAERRLVQRNHPPGN